MESEHSSDDEGWTREWRPPYQRHGLRYHESPSFRTMMQVLTAMDPHLDRIENRGDLLTVRNNRIWLWPLYGYNLRRLFTTLSVEVSLHCILESFIVYITEEIFDSSMESIVVFFVTRVYSGVSWNSVLLYRLSLLECAKGTRWSVIGSPGLTLLETVLGRYAQTARKIYLSIQQCEHAPIRRGPRVVCYNWRWIDHWLESDTESGSD